MSRREEQDRDLAYVALRDPDASEEDVAAVVATFASVRTATAARAGLVAIIGATAVFLLLPSLLIVNGIVAALLGFDGVEIARAIAHAIVSGILITLWVLLVRSLHRSARRRVIEDSLAAGACIACGFALGGAARSERGIAICSECGREVPLRVRLASDPPAIDEIGAGVRLADPDAEDPIAALTRPPVLKEPTATIRRLLDLDAAESVRICDVFVDANPNAGTVPFLAALGTAVFAGVAYLGFGSMLYSDAFCCFGGLGMLGYLIWTYPMFVRGHWRRLATRSIVRSLCFRCRYPIGAVRVGEDGRRTCPECGFANPVAAKARQEARRRDGSGESARDAEGALDP